MRSRKALLCTVGALVLAASLAGFLLLTGRREPIDWAGLIFILLPELIFFGALALLDHLSHSSGSLFLCAGSVTVLTLYAAAAIGASLLFMLLFRGSLGALVAIELILWALCLILLVLLMAASRFAARSEGPQCKKGDDEHGT